MKILKILIQVVLICVSFIIGYSYAKFSQNKVIVKESIVDEPLNENDLIETLENTSNLEDEKMFLKDEITKTEESNIIDKDILIPVISDTEKQILNNNTSLDNSIVEPTTNNNQMIETIPTNTIDMQETGIIPTEATVEDLNLLDKTDVTNNEVDSLTGTSNTLQEPQILDEYVETGKILK